MFTLVEQYKKLFMAEFLRNGGADLVNADQTGNNNGILDTTEFNSLPDSQKRSIQRFLEQQGRWDDFLESGRIAYERREEARQSVIGGATQAERQHSDTIEGSADIFSGGLIRPGQSGERVRALQEAISQWFSDLSVTGTYDQNTQAAIRGLQNYYNENSGQSHISVDGVFGDEGRRALRWLQQNAGGRNTRPERTQASPNGSRESREQVTQSHIIYPPQGREATIVLQQIIGANPDGVFGANSRRQLQRFLQAQGLYTGPIDGDIGRGSRAAIDAYNSGLRNNTEVGQTLEGTRSLRGSEVMNTHISRRARPILDALQRSITPAVNSRPDFQRLTRSIFEMQSRGQFDSNVWNQFIALAQSQGWNDFLTHVNNPNLTDQDKYMILTNGIAESAMGGSGIFELLNRPSTTVAELVAFETSHRRGVMLDVLSNQSGIPRSTLEQARAQWISQAPQNFSSTTFNRGEVFSTRRQQRGDGVLSGLQPFLNHSVVTLRGRTNYIPISYNAPQLVRRMTDIAIGEIQNRILRDRGGSFTLDQIRDNIANRRTVNGVSFDYDLGYFKSADCFNDAIGVIPRITVLRRYAGGGVVSDQRATRTGGSVGGNNNTGGVAPGGFGSESTSEGQF